MSKTAIQRKNMVHDIEDIRARLPHRYPFLLIDRIVEQRPNECVGVKNITINEPCFTGHFPDQAIMPGMLLAEAMAQTAAFVGDPEQSMPDAEDGEKRGFLTSMNLKVFHPVIPGDQVVIRTKLMKTFGKITKFTAIASVDNDVVASAEFTVASIS